MAREEVDREDLLREATALVERIELSLAATGSNRGQDAAQQSVVAGFRAGGAASFFFGADPVYQFNAAGELRRAYCGGQLIKAARGRLVSLTRRRQADQVQLLSHELDDAAEGRFMAEMSERLRGLATELASGRYAVLGQVPPDADVLGRVNQWLATHEGRSIANSPRVEP